MKWKDELKHGNFGPCSVIIMSETLYLVELCFRMHRGGFTADMFHSQAGCLIRGCLWLHDRRRSTHIILDRPISKTIIYIYSLAHRWCSREQQCSTNLLWATECSRPTVKWIQMRFHQLCWSGKQELMSFGQLVFFILMLLSGWTYSMLYEDENNKSHLAIFPYSS